MERTIKASNGTTIYVSESPVTKKILAELRLDDGQPWKRTLSETSVSDAEIGLSLGLTVNDDSPLKPGTISWSRLTSINLQDSVVHWGMVSAEVCDGHIDRTYLRYEDLVIHMDIVEDTLNYPGFQQALIKHDQEIKVSQQKALLREDYVLEVDGWYSCLVVRCHIQLKKPK